MSNVEVLLTVGKLDASLALLTTQDHHVIEFPTMLLPDNVKAGSIVKLSVGQNLEEEKRQHRFFRETQMKILEKYGIDKPKAPVLKTVNVTQTSCVLAWDPLDLGSARLKSLILYRQGVRSMVIPSPLKTMTTKISGLSVDTDYEFQLKLSTTSGQYWSEKVKMHTHKMTDMSGITVCLGPLDPLQNVTGEQIAQSLDKIGARCMQKHTAIDTTHFVTNETDNEDDPELARAKNSNIPIVRPEWVRACETERRIVGVRGFYLDADPSILKSYQFPKTTNFKVKFSDEAETIQSKTSKEESKEEAKKEGEETNIADEQALETKKESEIAEQTRDDAPEATEENEEIPETKRGESRSEETPEVSQIKLQLEEVLEANKEADETPEVKKELEPISEPISQAEEAAEAQNELKEISGARKESEEAPEVKEESLEILEPISGPTPLVEEAVEAQKESEDISEAKKECEEMPQVKEESVEILEPNSVTTEVPVTEVESGGNIATQLDVKESLQANEESEELPKTEPQTLATPEDTLGFNRTPMNKNDSETNHKEEHEPESPIKPELEGNEEMPEVHTEGELLGGTQVKEPETNVKSSENPEALTELSKEPEANEEPSEATGSTTTAQNEPFEVPTTPKVRAESEETTELTEETPERPASVESVLAPEENEKQEGDNELEDDKAAPTPSSGGKKNKNKNKNKKKNKKR